jgi:hypothetical protein
MNSIVLAVLLTAANPSFEAQTLDGQVLTGTLDELSASRLTMATEKGKTSLETETLLTISLKQKQNVKPASAAVIVELTDGSIVQAQQYVARKGQAKITLPGGTVLDVPTSAVQTVRFAARDNRPQQAKSLSTEWSRLIEKKAESDLLVAIDAGALDYHQGVLNDVTEEHVDFDLGGQLLPVKRAKVYGIVYRHSEAAALPATVCRISDSSGSDWSVKSLALEGERLQWTTPTGMEVRQPLENLSAIDFSAGKLVYLSDLQPERTAWTPYFAADKPMPVVERFYAPRRDQGFDGGALQLGGAVYPKGLAICGRTEMVYHLPGPFSRFCAMTGIDDAEHTGGKVRLVIRGDGKVLLEKTIADGDAPRAVNLNLSGVERLTILVDFEGGRLFSGDRLLLCNARITK